MDFPIDFSKNPETFWEAVAGTVTFLMIIIVSLALVAGICFILFLIGSWAWGLYEDWQWERGRKEREAYWKQMNEWHMEINGKTNDK